MIKTYFPNILVLKIINYVANKIKININVLNDVLLIFQTRKKVQFKTIFVVSVSITQFNDKRIRGDKINSPNIDECVNCDNDVLTHKSN